MEDGEGGLEVVTPLIIQEHERLEISEPHGPGLSKICFSHSCKMMFS